MLGHKAQFAQTIDIAETKLTVGKSEVGAPQAGVQAGGKSAGSGTSASTALVALLVSVSRGRGRR